MSDFVEAAASILSAAQERVQVAAQNVANMATPGYRRRISFEQIMADPRAGALPQLQEVTDFTPGKQTGTSNPYDIAISGPGFFAVQNGGQTLYTRDGQFKRDADNHLVTQRGMVVQAEGGGDLVVKSDQFQVKEDGSIVENGEAVGKLAIVDFSDRSKVVTTTDGLFSADTANVTTIERPKLRQAALESSNMSTGDEMVSIMASLRSAEAGERLMNVYDDLMGRVINAFSGA